MRDPVGGDTKTECVVHIQITFGDCADQLRRSREKFPRHDACLDKAFRFIKVRVGAVAATGF